MPETPMSRLEPRHGITRLYYVERYMYGAPAELQVVDEGEFDQLVMFRNELISNGRAPHEMGIALDPPELLEELVEEACQGYDYGSEDDYEYDDEF